MTLLPSRMALALVLVGGGTSALGALLSQEDPGGRGPALLNWGVGARAVSMANAAAAFSEDASVIFWNPGALNALTHREVLFTQSKGIFDQRHTAVAYVSPVWWGHERRTWGLSAASLTSDGFDLLDDGNVVARVEPKEYSAAFGYGQAWKQLNIGGTIRGIFQQTRSGNQGGAVGADIGFLSQGKRTQSGVVLANVGTSLPSGAGSIPPPTVLRGGVFRRLRVGSNDLHLSIQADLPFEERWQPRAGAEYALEAGKDRRVFFRGGLRRPQGDDAMEVLTLGFGFQSKGFRFNYAFDPRGDLGVSHVFEVALRFGQELPEERRQKALWHEIEERVAANQLIQAQALLRDLKSLAPNHPATHRWDLELTRRLSQSLDSETLYTLGYHALEKGDYEQSVDLFQRLLLVAPNHTEGKISLNEAQSKAASQRLQRIRESVELSRAVERDALLKAARKDLLAGAWTEGLKKWRRLMRNGENSQEAAAAVEQCRSEIYKLAEEAREKDAGGALSLYRSALDGQSQYRDCAARISELESILSERRLVQGRDQFLKGLAAYRQGNREEAATLFEQSLSLNPLDKSAQMALERVRAEMKRPRP